MPVHTQSFLARGRVNLFRLISEIHDIQKIPSIGPNESVVQSYTVRHRFGTDTETLRSEYLPFRSIGKGSIPLLLEVLRGFSEL